MNSATANGRKVPNTDSVSILFGSMLSNRSARLVSPPSTTSPACRIPIWKVQRDSRGLFKEDVEASVLVQQCLLTLRDARMNATDHVPHVARTHKHMSMAWTLRTWGWDGKLGHPRNGHRHRLGGWKHKVLNSLWQAH